MSRDKSGNQYRSAREDRAKRLWDARQMAKQEGAKRREEMYKARRRALEDGKREKAAEISRELGTIARPGDIRAADVS